VGSFCGHHVTGEAGQDKHGVQRRQTAGVPKRQFSASKKKEEGESAFSDFIGFCFIYRTVGIYGFYLGIGRIIHPRAAVPWQEKHVHIAFCKM
jgi:hypothetical protein